MPTLKDRGTTQLATVGKCQWICLLSLFLTTGSFFSFFLRVSSGRMPLRHNALLRKGGIYSSGSQSQFPKLCFDDHAHHNF